MDYSLHQDFVFILAPLLVVWEILIGNWHWEIPTSSQYHLTMTMIYDL